MTNKMRVLVLGGGVTGLSAAHYLRQLLPLSDISVLEASNRFGGWVSSCCHDDGVVFEHGPRTLRPGGIHGINTIQLVEQLQLQSSVRFVDYSNPAAKNRMVSVDGHLHSLPNSLLSLFRVLPPFQYPLAFSAIIDLFSPSPDPPLSDDDVYSFVSRRFGEHVARYAVDPLIRGVCAGDSHRISARLLFDTLFEYERQTGSVQLGLLRYIWRLKRGHELPPPSPPSSPLTEQARQQKWAVWFLHGGLQTLTDSLARAVRSSGTKLLSNWCVQQLEVSEEGATVANQDGERLSCDYVISAVPAPVLAGALSSDGCRDLSDQLARIASVDVAVVNLQFSDAMIPRPGFGYLVPSCQSHITGGVLGVTFDSCVNAPPAGASGTAPVVLTVMAGGADAAKHLGPGTPSSDQLLELALNELKRSLAIDQAPSRWQSNWLKQCIPQYHVGHRELITQLRQGLSQRQWPLELVGAPYDGIGVNDCIASGRRAAETVAASVQSKCR